MTAVALAPTPAPTHDDEAWRYADIDHVVRHWPLPAPEEVSVAAGETRTLTIAALPQDGIARLNITLADDAQLIAHILVTDAPYGRVEIAATLGARASLALRGVIVATGDETAEIVTTMHHAEPSATSEQIIRIVAADTATATYLGRVSVARDAQHTDSAQRVRGMLLNRGATINAKPELEIFADDVACAHGCAIGELDRNALFYLAARGLDETAARALLLEGFVREALADADDADALTARALSAVHRAGRAA